MGSRGTALLFLDHGTRRGWGLSVTLRPLFTRGKEPVPILQEAGWAPRPVWTGAENLAPTGIRSPAHPARSQSLYRLSYPGPQAKCRIRIWSYTTIIFSYNVAHDWMQQCDTLEYLKEKFRVSEGIQNVPICAEDHICSTMWIWTNIYVMCAHTSHFNLWHSVRHVFIIDQATYGISAVVRL